MQTRFALADVINPSPPALDNNSRAPEQTFKRCPGSLRALVTLHSERET